MALCGLGFGFFQSPNNRTLLGSVPAARAGAAGGMPDRAAVGTNIRCRRGCHFIRVSSENGANMALWAGTTIAVAAAVVSVSRLAAARGTLPPDQSLEA